MRRTTYDLLDNLEPSVNELRAIEGIEGKKHKPKVNRNGSYYNSRTDQDEMIDTLPVFVRMGIDEALRHEESY